MKVVYSILMFLSSCFGGSKPLSKPENMIVENNTKSNFYNFKMNAIDGKEIDFSMYKGKKVLVVNTASECGYTPQYRELQKLHQSHSNKVIVLGFPCDDFGGQEPGKNDDIAHFCQKNYGVTFQLFQKISVKGESIAPLYQWLTNKNKNGWNDKAPTWNFCKYLINENGELIKFFPSAVSPLSNEIIDSIK